MYVIQMFVTHAMGKNVIQGEGDQECGSGREGCNGEQDGTIEEMRPYTNLKEINICM